MIPRTLSVVETEIRPVPFTTRETVIDDTPASRATSLMVGRLFISDGQLS
jgi:hypothetical protein